MTSRTLFLKSIFLFAAFVGLTAYSATSSAYTQNMRFCGQWEVEYTDSGFGEDMLNGTGEQEIPAWYAQARIYNVTDGYTLMWSGNLGSDGCSPYVTVQSGKMYAFGQSTEIRNGASAFYVVQDSAGWTYTPRWSYAYLSISSGSSYGDYASTQNITFWDSKYTRVAAVAGQIMRFAGLLNYDAQTLIHVNSDNCAQTAYYGDGKVCVVADGTRDDTAWKHVTAHEIGHRQADDTLGPISISSYYASVTESECRCDHVTSSNGLHCIQSREYINTAQTEGYAQWFAAATFNSRYNSDCTFVYYKEMLTCTEPNPPFLPWCITWQPPQAINAIYHTRWMETKCPSEMTDRGVERDWMVFFWDLYKWPNLTFTTAEIDEIWENASYVGYYAPTWDQLLDSVEDLYGSSSTEYQFFVAAGAGAGVDH